MPATFTIEGELSPQGLLDAKSAIEDLLNEQASSSIDESDIPDESELALRKAKLLRKWAGHTTWHFMHTIAHAYQSEEEFTFNDLAETFSVDKETVKSWHRSASKIMNKVNAELGTEPAFMTSEWDGEKQRYRIPQVMRAALIASGD